jgi:hypothetical protein
MPTAPTSPTDPGTVAVMTPARASAASMVVWFNTAAAACARHLPGDGV